MDQLEPSQQSEDTDEVTLMSQTMSESSRFGPAELSNPLFASFRSDLGHFEATRAKIGDTPNPEIASNRLGGTPHD